MSYMKSLNFTNATDFIEFIQKNFDLIKNEKLNRVFQTGACCQFQRNSQMWSTDTSIVLEFNSIAILLDYMDISDIDMTIIDIDSFRAGKLWLDDWNDNFMPEENGEDVITEFSTFNQNISDIIIERFTHSFESWGPSGIGMAKEGGDYFASIVIMMGDAGIYLCAEPAEVDGWMDFGILHRNDLGRKKSGVEGIFEEIKL